MSGNILTKINTDRDDSKNPSKSPWLRPTKGAATCKSIPKTKIPTGIKKKLISFLNYTLLEIDFATKIRR